MNGNVSWTVDTSVFDKKQRRFLEGVKNASKPLKRWAVRFGTILLRALDKMTYGRLYSVFGRGAGITFREGIRWAHVGPQYKRKTDGVIVPPWGGVPRIRAGVQQKGQNVNYQQNRITNAIRATPGSKIWGRYVRFDKYKGKYVERVFGNVRGIQRPSGVRVKPGHVVGHDTGSMFNQFVRNPKLSPDKRSITLSTNKKQAERFNEKRPFNKLIQSDKEMLIEELQLWMDALAAEWNKRAA